jgi:hypothetical protein
MNQFIDALDKMKNMELVRFFAQFFSGDGLSKLFGRFINSSGGLAGRLLLWAVVLALGVFLVDQAFYWSKPGRLEHARGTWRGIASGAASAWAGTKSLALRVKSVFSRKCEAPHAHR